MGRWLGAVCSVLLLLPAMGSELLAQTNDKYPSQTIKFVAPFPAGGTTDIVGRILAHRMSKSLGQAVIVENKVGASGAIGVVAVAQAPADGYTALIGASTAIVINPHVTKVSYDVARDLKPVGLIMKAETLIVAHPSKGLKSLQDIVAYAKANPGKLTYGSVGIGSSAHLAMAHLQAASDIDIVADPHYIARDNIVSVDNPRIGPVRMQGVVPRFVGAAPRPISPAPALGEHTADVLGEMLGLPEDRIKALAEQEIIGIRRN